MESELVSGFMTEHAAVIFVFFFLAEYGSIVLMCILTSIFFLGGYLFISLNNILDISILIYNTIFSTNYYPSLITDNCIIEGLINSLTLGLKSCLMIFSFIWVRASFPRVRFDQLMLFCWTVLLPIVIAIIVLVPCILYSFDIVPNNLHLL